MSVKIRKPKKEAAARFADIILSLIQFGVPRNKIAGLFGTTVNNISAIISRHEKKRRQSNKKTELPVPPSLNKLIRDWKSEGKDWTPVHLKYEADEPSSENSRAQELGRLTELLQSRLRPYDITQHAERFFNPTNDEEKSVLEKYTPLLDNLDHIEQDAGYPIEPVMVTYEFYSFISAQTGEPIESLLTNATCFKQYAVSVECSIEEILPDLHDLHEFHNELVPALKGRPNYEHMRGWEMYFWLRRFRKSPNIKPFNLIDSNALLEHLKSFRSHSIRGKGWRNFRMQSTTNLLIAQHEYFFGEYKAAYKSAILGMEAARKAFADTCGANIFLLPFSRCGVIAMGSALLLNKAEVGLMVASEVETALHHFGKQYYPAFLVTKARLFMKCERDGEALAALADARDKLKDLPDAERQIENYGIDRLANVLEGRICDAFDLLNQHMRKPVPDEARFCALLCDAFDAAFSTDNECAQDSVTRELTKAYVVLPQDHPRRRDLLPRWVISQLQLTKPQRIRLIRQLMNR